MSEIKEKAAELRGVVSAPPSKSLSHRYMIAAALSEGESVIDNLCLCDDIEATVDCLRSLGADISLAGSRAVIRGMDFSCKEIPPLDCRQSGSTLRFLLPLGGLFDGDIRFTGSPRLMQRGAAVYAEAFAPAGVTLLSDPGGITVRGRFSGHDFTLPGHFSSQYVTGLLLLLPLLGGGSVKLSTPAASRPYIDLTVKTLAEFGVIVGEQDDKFTVSTESIYKVKQLYTEGDWSNGAFLLALAKNYPGVKVTGLDPKSLQGDRICGEYFNKLDKNRVEMDITHCPDLAPVLMAYGAMRKGVTLYGTERLKNKESSRAETMARELAKLGVTVRQEYDRLTVYPAPLRRPDTPIDSHDDHRIAMAMTLLLLRTGGTLRGARAVAKSYPAFFKECIRLGAKLRLTDENEAIF